MKFHPVREVSMYLRPFFQGYFSNPCHSIFLVRGYNNHGDRFRPLKIRLCPLKIGLWEPLPNAYENGFQKKRSPITPLVREKNNTTPCIFGHFFRGIPHVYPMSLPFCSRLAKTGPNDTTFTPFFPVSSPCIVPKAQRTCIFHTCKLANLANRGEVLEWVTFW